jgi:hypothetical protein
LLSARGSEKNPAGSTLSIEAVDAQTMGFQIAYNFAFLFGSFPGRFRLMPWSRSPLPFVIAAAVLAVPPAAWADAPVPSGSVVAVIQQANAVGSPTGKRMLDVAAPVYIGDQIQTGDIGEAQLRFRDSTKLVVGPNSNLVIDDFVYKNRGTAEDVSINAVRGTFRFITGSSPKNAYSLKTPVATIGVRQFRPVRDHDRRLRHRGRAARRRGAPCHDAVRAQSPAGERLPLSEESGRAAARLPHRFV